VTDSEAATPIPVLVRQALLEDSDGAWRTLAAAIMSGPSPNEAFAKTVRSAHQFGADQSDAPTRARRRPA
jgi:hypothetical protein